MAASTFDREVSFFIAILAEQADRYDEVAEAMKRVVKMGSELTAEERDLLSVGYWNVLGRRRDSWGHLLRIELEEESGGSEANLRRIIEYKQRVETEIEDICTEVLSIIDEHLIPSISNPDASVFYYKMKGDHYRYLAEFKTGSDKDEAADKAAEAYETAMATAVAELPRADPLRLGLDLNLSVLYHVILDSPQRACNIAKQAVDEATPELRSLSKEAYKRSTKMLRVLKDNIELWNCDGLELCNR